jgi:transketolase
MGIPDEPYWAPTDLVSAYRAQCAERGAALFEQWSKRRAASSLDDDVWDACWAASGVAGWQANLPTFAQGDKIATRVAIEKAFNASLDGVPGLLAGAADLTGNTGNKLDGQLAQSVEHPGGRQMYYGIREHAMGAAMVGMALHGGVLPAGGTFFVFLDYMRPAVRLAALSRAKVVFVWTHDSVGVGEDGPTHQPIEHLATLRAIPGLQVIRPADANETVAAWQAAVQHDGPTALVLSRQAVTVCTDGSAVATGAAVVRDCVDPQVVLVATGSEVSLCVTAAEQLGGAGIRAIVVSMPSWDRFAAQSGSYQESVLPAELPVLSVEAAVTFGWERYADESIGIDRFGASAPGNVVLDKLGINVANVVAAATRLAQSKG